MPGFIKNIKILEETHETEDLLGFSDIQKEFKSKLINIPKSSIVGLVGNFGTGKSTMLYQLSSSSPDVEVWIQFDAWKYPDRNNLWEGFVLDVADQLGKRSEALKRIEGKSVKSKIFDITTDVLSIITDKLPDLNFLDKFTELFKRSPAKRTFEIQQILKSLIEQETREIYIVIEDIDRSGDKGVYFLETLRQFLRSAKLNKKVTCIVPISNQSHKEYRHSYLKSIDYFHRFDPGQIDFKDFINFVFDDSIFDGSLVWVEQLNFLFKRLIGSKDLTIREIKNIIRNADWQFAILTNVEKSYIDIRIFVLFAFADHLGIKIVSKVNEDYKLKDEEDWIKKTLILIANKTTKIGSFTTEIPLYFVNNDNLKIPNFTTSSFISTERAYYLSDKYLSLCKLI